MNVGSLRALVYALNSAAHGVPATVVRPVPFDAVIQTTAIFLTSTPEETLGTELRRRGRIRQISVPAFDVPTLPRNTVITAAEPGDVERRWRVETAESPDAFRRIATVVAETEPA